MGVICLLPLRLVLAFSVTLTFLGSQAVGQRTIEHQTQCIYSFVTSNAQRHDSPGGPCQGGPADDKRIFDEHVTQLQGQLATLMEEQQELASLMADLRGKKRRLEERVRERLRLNGMLGDQMSKLQDRAVTLKEEIEQRKIDTEHQDVKNVRDASNVGVTYVHWGRRTCRQGTPLLYHGHGAGSYWGYSGGGLPYLCISDNPQWLNYTDDFQGQRAQLFGAEYEEDEYFPPYVVPGHGPLDKARVDDSTIDNHDVPCAVCQADDKRSKVMIPAKTSCPPGWRAEYDGYLMTEGHKQGKSNYICIDGEPDVEPFSSTNTRESTAYYVEARCGVLSCDQYVNGRELTCVVCTQ